MTPERWEKIDRLFHEALEHEPAERLRFLARECADDPTLGREVETLLASYGQAESFIETPASDLAAALLEEDRSRLVAGQMVGPFRVAGVLAAGGMGEVYLADDTRLGRKVALKLLPPQFTIDEDRVRRFGQEARAASALNHPNIVTIHEVGQADSLHYIATEYVEGETLREHMAGTRMTVGEVLDVAAQVASALEAAHEAGIVHRDIKPENVMLRRDRLVKVLDFGLAKLAPQRAMAFAPQPPTESRVKTNPGVVMGTVGYMSPEQARGEEVDARSDIWSLGVVLYEMAAGRAPFKGETPSHTVVSILEREPPALCPDTEVSATLERIISKALSKERAERYQTAGDLALDLKSLKEELTVESRLKQFRRPDADGGETATKSNGHAARNTAPASAASTSDAAIARLRSSAEYLVNGIKRHRGGVVFASTTAFLLVASLVYFSNFTGGGDEAIDSVAVMPFVNAGDDPEAEYLADGISDSVIGSLSQLPNLRVISLNAVSRYKGRQIDPQVVGRELNVRAVLMGRLVSRGGDLAISTELVDARDNRRLWGGQYTRPMSDILVVQDEIAGEIAEKLRLRLGGAGKQRLTKHHTESTDAYHAYLKGRYLLAKRTPQTTEKSIEYFEQAIKLDPNYALAYATLANARLSLAKLKSRLPEEVLPQAKVAAAKALGIDDTLAEAHAALGSVRFYEWDWSGAEREFKRASELNPNYERNDSDYEHYLLAMKRFDEAVAESKRVLELEPVSVDHNRNVGMILYFARQYDEAIEQCHKTLELDPNMMTVYAWLAAAYEQKKLYDQSVAASLKGREVSGVSPEEVKLLRETYAKSGWEGYWRKVLDSSREKAKQGYVNPHLFAGIYARLGEKDQAFAWLEKSYKQRITAMKFLNTDPLWDGLRADPRYADLVRRMGLEP